MSFLMVPLINQKAVIGISPQKMPYAISLTNMLRQLGSFGIAIMNTYVAQRSKHTELI